MKITILCSDKNHPIYSYLRDWKDKNLITHEINIFSSTDEILNDGDILFLISCNEIVKSSTRKKFRFSLVLHASDLPSGRGWSPHIWDILNNKDFIVLSLLNAEDGVDTGAVWKKIKIPLNGYELYDEINSKLFEAEISMLDWAIENIDKSKPNNQKNSAITYYKKRSPKDSRIDTKKSIKSQFNLLRVCDPNRFPCWFEIDGNKFKLTVTRYEDE